MRTIYYVSNFRLDLFPNNTRANFESYIYPADLQYIGESADAIEVAIKSITFDYDIVNESYQTLALKSNLSYDTISSYGWNNIVSIFTLNKLDKGIIHLEFNNPTFFPSSHQKLCRAKFSIIDTETNQAPHFSLGSPTFIEVVVRHQIPRMKNPFHILLDSSCVESKKRFPKNNNTEFIIQLPQRMEFQRDWSVCLKSIHYSTNFRRIYDAEFTYTLVSEAGRRITIRTIIPHDKVWNIQELIEYLNNTFDRYISFRLLDDGKVFIFHLITDYKKRREEFLSYKANEDNHDYGKAFISTDNYGKLIVSTVDENAITHSHSEISMSSNLASILGFDFRSKKLTPKERIISKYASNFNVLIPHQFIVCCNIVEESILGGQRVQILKYFSKQISDDLDVVDHHFINNDFVTLNLKNFDRIHIRIADITGNTIRCDSITPTRLQLLFINTNSA